MAPPLANEKTPGTCRGFSLIAPDDEDQAATVFAESWYSSIWSKFM
ncbi:hypothetical protein FHY09_002293 [Xanthomonas sp. 60]